MKKNFLFIAIAFFLCNIVVAQKLKVDLDPKFFTYEYVELPQYFTDPSKRTFDVVTNNSSEYYWLYNNEVYSRKIAINGFTRSSSAPTILIEVVLEPMMDNGSSIITKSSTKKADGTEVKTYASLTKYKGTGKYIINYDGKVSTYPLSKEVSEESSASSDYNRISDIHYNNSRAKKEALTRQFVDYSIEAIYNQVNSLYGYRVVTQSESLWILGSKDNPEFTGHQDAMGKVKDNCSRLTYNSTTQLTYDELKPIIEYFEKTKTTYTDPEDKKHKKMRYSAYYNLMKIYYALDMFDKAMEQANGLIANDYDTNDGEAMVKRINAIKSKMAVNNSSTTHMEIAPIYVR